MKEARINFLKAEIEKHPEDPFNHYALALEYVSSDIQQSAQIFDHMLKDFPNYLPVYFHAAAAHIELESDESQIKSIFEKGINLANQLKDEKALKELKGAFQNWEFER